MIFINSLSLPPSHHESVKDQQSALVVTLSVAASFHLSWFFKIAQQLFYKTVPILIGHIVSHN